MKYIASIIVVAFGVWAFFVYYNDDSSQKTNELSVKEQVRLATSTIPLAVAGVVEAADKTIIYAQTPGVVRLIPQKEGSVVLAGMLLVEQDKPVADAQVALAQAQSALTDAQQQAQITLADTAHKRATVRAYTAEELAILRSQSDESRIKEITAVTSAASRTSVATILSAMDFINTNRSLYSSEGLEAFDRAVRLVYGEKRTHFDPDYIISSQEVSLPEGPLFTSTNRTNPTIAEAQMTATLAAQVLIELDRVFASAEPDVFDGDKEQSDTLKDSYLNQKSLVTNSLVSIETVLSEAAQVADGTLQDKLNQNLSVLVANIDESDAKQQAELAQHIAMYAQGVAVASIGVAASQQSLGSITAPFGGVVSDVLVEEGTYVMPGTPLLELTGAGAEVIVTIPDTFIPFLAAGQPLLQGDVVIGTVDRFSPVATGHGVKVVITLDTNKVKVGSVIRGQLAIKTEDYLYSAPRAYVHFTSDGPQVAYEDGTVSEAKIVYDSGDSLILSVEKFSTSALRPVYGTTP